MTFEITRERESYLKASGSIVLNACPGSGKTTTIAHKLVGLERNWSRLFGGRCGIACLSFTNVAKDEIATTFRETSGFSLSYPHIISTIDSFVNLYITLPFVHRLMTSGGRFRIVDDIVFLDRFFGSQWALIKKYKNVFYRFSPSKVDFAVNGGFKWDGNHVDHSDPSVTYCKEVKEAQLKARLLKTSDSAYLALMLLKKFPRIAKYLVARFPYVIIDEAQDTSDIQHAILEQLRTAGLSHIELVGDPYQCLYEWRDASPDLFMQKYENPQWQALTLTDNRRSVQTIVDVFSPLRRATEKKILSTNLDDSAYRLHVLKYDPGNCAAIIPAYRELCHRFNLSNNRVLVRGNALKSALLGTLADFKPWGSEFPYQLVAARLFLESNQISDAVKTLRRAVLNNINSDSDFDTLKTLEEELESDHQFHASIFPLLRNLPTFDKSVKDWTQATQSYLKTQLDLSNDLDFVLRKRSSSTFQLESLSLPMTSFFRKASAGPALPIMTVHQAKGMTFDSVLLLLSANSKGQNISLADYHTPVNLPTEKQRIIYVAMSRPKSLLCLGVPNTVTDSDLHLKLGTNIIIS